MCALSIAYTCDELCQNIFCYSVNCITLAKILLQVNSSSPCDTLQQYFCGRRIMFC